MTARSARAARKVARRRQRVARREHARDREVLDYRVLGDVVTDADGNEWILLPADVAERLMALEPEPDEDGDS